MGRIGETLRRTLQLADAMKRWRASEAGAGLGRRAGGATAPPGGAGGRRARPTTTSASSRYLAKCTVEPARSSTASPTRWARSRPGASADIVLWWATHVGVKPLMVFKGGVVAWSAMGEGNASVHGAEPTRYGPDWGALGTRRRRRCRRRTCRRRRSTPGSRRRSGRAGGWPRSAGRAGSRARTSWRTRAAPPVRVAPVGRDRHDRRQGAWPRRPDRDGAAVAPLPAGLSGSGRRREGVAGGVDGALLAAADVDAAERRAPSNARRRPRSRCARRSPRTRCRRAGATTSTTRRRGPAGPCPSARRRRRAARARGRTATSGPPVPPSRARLTTIAPALQPAHTAPRSIAVAIAASSGESCSTSARCVGLPPEK